MTSPTSPPKGTPRSQQTAITMIALGAALVVVIGNILDGFFGGLAQGAGITLILIGVFTLSPFLRRKFRRTPSTDDTSGRDGLWLPSEDGRGERSQ